MIVVSLILVLNAVAGVWLMHRRRRAREREGFLRGLRNGRVSNDQERRRILDNLRRLK